MDSRSLAQFRCSKQASFFVYDLYETLTVVEMLMEERFTSASEEL